MSSRARSRWIRAAVWFLSITYAIGAPVTAYAELKAHVISQRFDYSPSFIYWICAIQLFCAVALWVSGVSRWAAAVLTVITVGAVFSHFRIGSPVTALPAVAYTAIQSWYGLSKSP